MNRILLTTDFSEDSTRAFSKATELAKAQGLGITLVHVVLDVHSSPQGAALAPPLSSPEISDEIAEAREEIKGFAKQIGAGVDVATEILAGEDVAKTITKYAEKHEIELIALATTGRTGLRRLVMGSVAEEVIRHSTVPVFVVPA